MGLGSHPGCYEAEPINTKGARPGVNPGAGAVMSGQMRAGRVFIMENGIGQVHDARSLVALQPWTKTPLGSGIPASVAA